MKSQATTSEKLTARTGSIGRTRRVPAAFLVRCFTAILASITLFPQARGASQAPTAYSYDANNQLTQVTYPDSQTINYTYDDMGNLTAVATTSTAPPAITTGSPLPSGAVGAVYSQTLTATGGTTPYTWTLVSGSLPAVLKLSTAGAISGTPSAGATASFRVRVTGANGGSSEQDFSLVIVDVFGPVLGTYNGLILQTTTPTHASSGAITIKLGNTGAFTATLTLGGSPYSFKSQFDANGNATIAVPRTGLSMLTVLLHLDTSGDTGEITGTVSDGAFTADVLSDRAVYGKTNPCPWAGQYSFVLEPAQSDPEVPPQGYSFGTLTVATTGGGTLSGVLADGTKIKGKLSVSKYGTFLLYTPLYGNQGSCIGLVTITNNTLEAVVDWFKPPVANSVYDPAGFTTTLALVGSKYVVPATGAPMLDLANAAGNVLLTLDGGNLNGALSNLVTVAPNNTVTILSGTVTNLTLKLTPKTSQFSGSFLHPVTGKVAKFQGVVLQLQNVGAGCFLGTNASGYVTIEPAQ